MAGDRDFSGGAAPVGGASPATFSVQRYGSAVDIENLQLYLYGNSYAAFPAGWHTLGQHYGQILRDLIGASSVSTYAVGGRRIVDVVTTLNTGQNWNGSTGVIASGVWTTTANRPGIIVIDAIGNDAAHYPSMVAGGPAKITGASASDFLNGVAAMWRAALAIASSDARVDSVDGVYAGTWSGNTPFTGMYGGSFRQSTVNGSTATFTVTGASKGANAGKAYLLGVLYDPDSGATSSNFSISVDGGAAQAYTVGAWERYVGHSGGNIDFVPAAYEFDIPADGLPHSVVVTHTGTAGHALIIDCVIVPANDPNLIVVPSHSLPPVPMTGLLSATDIANWSFNIPIIEPVIKTVVDEFPNAIWVPSTMTVNGLTSTDGIHPNDRGMMQRANDIINALSGKWSKYANYGLAVTPDRAFGKV